MSQLVNKDDRLLSGANRPEDFCRLCGRRKALQLGHIIPSFVSDWLKKSSVTGFFRYRVAPNRRSQDGVKRYLLCEDCEESFSRWEKAFAEDIFSPLNEGKGSQFSYGPWLLKFVTSVSWRVLTFFEQENNLSHFSPRLLDSSDKALVTWKEFLLGKRPHPGSFEQHMLLLDVVAQHNISSLPSNINRYILRTTDMDSVCSDSNAFIYAKLGKILLFGFIRMDCAKQWMGTKVRVMRGVLGTQNYQLPDTIWDYIQSRARISAGVNQGLSERQKGNIDDSYRRKIDEFVKSEMFRAVEQDVALFGQKAFEKEDGASAQGRGDGVSFRETA